MPSIHDIARFDPFIQNWEVDTSLTILSDCAYFLLAVMVEEHESSRLRMAN